MLKAVIMDFDGLIVDTETVWYTIYADWFKEHVNYDLTVREFLSCVGADSGLLFERLAAKGINIDPDEFSRSTYELFLERSRNLPPMEGVESFLTAVKDNGLKVALATSAGIVKVNYHLQRLGLEKYFDLLVTSEDVANIKPAPDLFIEAQKRLNLKAGECLIAEDSLNGLVAGINAGMRVLIVPNEITRYSDFEGEYQTYSSLADVNVAELIENFPD